MQNREETVSGNVAERGQSTWTLKDGRLAHEFRMCVGSGDEKVWYVIQSKGELAEFAIDHLQRGERVLCRGTVTDRGYTRRDGTRHNEPVMHARYMRLRDGTERFMPEIDLEQKVDGPKREETESERAARIAGHLEQYPLRWMRPGFAADHPFFDRVPDAWIERMEWENGDRRTPDVALMQPEDVRRGLRALTIEIGGKRDEEPRRS